MSTLVERVQAYRTVKELLDSSEPIRFVIFSLLRFGYSKSQVLDIMWRHGLCTPGEADRIIRLYKMRELEL